jgi:succinate dehydrogenase/fumarate reductase flavoprotein subunit
MHAAAPTRDHAAKTPSGAPSGPPNVADCDLLVVGSGAGGLSAAVTAATLGLRVIVVEKDAVYGGTTAWSGGWMWIPRNPLAQAAGIREDIEAPRRYLRHELGAQYDPARIDAFLQNGPRMVEFFRSRTALQFIDGNLVPDFHGGSPGAAEGGRSVCAAPFDARELGPELARLRRPLDLIAPWGMGIASGAVLRHFLNAMRSAESFGHVARRVAVHMKDLCLHGRGMHLVAGNALVARLAKTAFERGVEIRTSSPVRRLLHEAVAAPAAGSDAKPARVVGAVVADAHGHETEIRARRGVVLACGGFPHDAERRHALFGERPCPAHWSAAVPSATGDGLRLGESVGAQVANDLPAAGAWAPVSLVPRADGSVGHFPHLIERAKPGLIAVTRAGRRFANEADSYYDVMQALFQAVPAGAPVEAWLICDHRFIRRYGLGHVRPAPAASTRPPCTTRWRATTPPRGRARTPTSAAARPATTACRATPASRRTRVSRRSSTARITPCASCRATWAPSPACAPTPRRACSTPPASRCPASTPAATT